MIKSNQKYTSKNTSINKKNTPSIFREVKSKSKWIKGSTNLDLGGGRYDILTHRLNEEFSIRNLIYDPYNRSKEHNDSILSILKSEKADTSTISNVLNVIKEEKERINLLKNAFFNIKDSGTLYITVYEGNRTGVGKLVRNDQFQLNKKTSEYLDEIKKVFPKVEIKGKLIICKK